VLYLVKVNSNYAHVKQAGFFSPGILPGVGFCERSATTESGAASGQRMSFPDYVSAQGPVPILWTPMDPVVFSLLRRAALVDPQRTCGWAWGGPTPRRGGETSRMVGDCRTTLPLGWCFSAGPIPFPPPTAEHPMEPFSPLVVPALLSTNWAT